MISRTPMILPTGLPEEGSALAGASAGTSCVRWFCTVRPEEGREAEELRAAAGAADDPGTARRLQRASPSAEKTLR